MGVGLPFAVGAKAAKPNSQVICLHGDGSFGQNAMELDTAVRHKLPLLCVISLNGGWTADPDHDKPGRDLGYTRYDKMAEALGCYAEYVEEPEDIRPPCSAPGRRSRRAWSALSTSRPTTAPARRRCAFRAAKPDPHPTPGTPALTGGRPGLPACGGSEASG